MFKGLGNIAALFKEAQNIGPKMEQITADLKTKVVSGSAGGGMVTVNANGLGQVINVEIDPMLIEKGDVEMVKDLLPAAINIATAKAKQLHVESMKSLTGGIPLPGGLDQMMNQFTGGAGATEPTDDDGPDASGPSFE